MARVAVIVTVTFFLFAFSHARTPLDLPENDVLISDPSNTLPESETKTTILLPSEKPESEPATVIEWEPDTTKTKPRDSETTAVESTDALPVSETETLAAVGVTQPFEIVFHPVNRHFHPMHPKRPFPFRFPHRCRHHFKQGGPRFNGRELPYGNDMILSSEDMPLDPMSRGGVHQIPARWVRFHHHERPRFPYRHHEWNNEEDVTRPHHHMREGEEMEHHHMREGEETEENEHEERKEGGVLKRFRKFLHHF